MEVETEEGGREGGREGDDGSRPVGTGGATTLVSLPRAEIADTIDDGSTAGFGGGISIISLDVMPTPFLVGDVYKSTFEHPFVSIPSPISVPVQMCSPTLEHCSRTVGGANPPR